MKIVSNHIRRFTRNIYRSVLEPKLKKYCEPQLQFPLLKTFFASLGAIKGDIFNVQRLSNNDMENSHVTEASVGRSQQEAISPPDCVRGMKILNRDLFKATVAVPSIYIENNLLSLVKNKAFKKLMLKVPGIKAVQNLPDEDVLHKTHKKILFKPSMHINGQVHPCILPFLSPHAESHLPTFKLCDIELKYENWNYDDILDAILPEGGESVGGYSIIGHIVHLNLRNEVIDYKNIIGEVLLDKVIRAKTVVNKLDIIDNTFRNFRMEVVAGEPDFITEVKEFGVSYKMDFSKVYWNTKLGTEHRRVVEDLKNGGVVFDVFAGIGPFAIPATKRKCHVYANDLNPESFKWMNENILANRIKNIKTFNLDGRDFVKTIAKEEMIRLMQEVEDDGTENPELYFVMNLPALAVEFTDVFPGLLSDVDKTTLRRILLPKIYCYTFSKAENLELDVKERIESAMKWSLPDDLVVRNVRNVAPSKEMMCATFRLTEDVLFTERQLSDVSDCIEPPAKKQKEAE